MDEWIGTCFIGHFIRFFGIPVHDNYIAKFHTDSESLLKRHKTVRDTTVASSYHRLKSDGDVIQAVADLESRIPMGITYYWVEGHQDKMKDVRELPWPAQLNGRANDLRKRSTSRHARDECRS
jgi:hypothetical protein